MPANLRQAREAAEQFRSEHITGQIYDGRFPIDTVYIADNRLRLDLVPFHGLVETINSAAYVTSGLKELYLDEEMYSAYDSPYVSPRKKDRLRFSVAHEIGHIFLHAALVPKIRCQKIEDLKTLFNSADGQRYDIEKEANEFAGRLIVPCDILEQALAAFVSGQNEDPRWRDSEELRSRFCEQCGPRFGLNTEGMRTRLDREGLWPSEWTQGG